MCSELSIILVFDTNVIHFIVYILLGPFARLTIKLFIRPNRLLLGKNTTTEKLPLNSDRQTELEYGLASLDEREKEKKNGFSFL